MSYRVRFETKAERKLDKLTPKLLSAVLNRIERIAIDPFDGARKIHGQRHAGFRVRVSDYRILFQIDTNAREVLIYDIDKREGIYKQKS